MTTLTYKKKPVKPLSGKSHKKTKKKVENCLSKMLFPV